MAEPWNLTPDEVLALPIDELALLVLRDAHETSAWNWRNWLLERNRLYQGRKDILQALSEAWGWLQSHNLTVWNPDQDSFGSFIISRMGHQALAEGLPWLKAVARLDIELVTALEVPGPPPLRAWRLRNSRIRCHEGG